MPSLAQALNRALHDAMHDDQAVVTFGLDVGVNGGEIARQCFDAGLLDEVYVDLVPVFLGSGIPLLGAIKTRRWSSMALSR